MNPFVDKHPADPARLGGRMEPGGSGGLQNRTDPPMAGGVGSIPTRSRHARRRSQTLHAPGRSQASALAGIIGIALGIVMAAPSQAAAQQKDSARAGVAPVAPQAAPDTAQKPAKAEPVAGGPLKPPISPGTAFLYSFILPGYGQSRLDRAYAGALFFGVEAVAIVRLRQAQIDLKYAQNHVNDSTLVVQTYQTNPATGQPLRDSTGAPIPATYAYSKYDSALVAARKTHVEDWWAVIIFNHLVSGADAFIEAQLWDLPAHVHPIARESPEGRHLYGASVTW